MFVGIRKSFFQHWPLTQPYNWNTQFENRTPFIFDKYSLQTLECQSQRSCLWFLWFSKRLSYVLEEWVWLWLCSSKWENTASSDCFWGSFLQLPFPSMRLCGISFTFGKDWGEVSKRIRNLKLQGKICMWKAINILFTLLSRCSLSDIYYTAAIYIFNHCPLIDAVKYFWIRHLGFVCALKLSFVL